MTELLIIILIAQAVAIMILWKSQNQIKAHVQLKSTVNKKVIPTYDHVDNEFIRAHRRQMDVKEFNARVKMASSNMAREKKERRIKEYPAYVEWCKRNRIQPMFKDAKALNHVIG